MSSEILQIIPAQLGWEAVYAYEQFDDDRLQLSWLRSGLDI
jgi:hypothetical protein